MSIKITGQRIALGSHLSGVASRSCLLILLNGGLCSGFSLQQDFSRGIRRSSQISADRVGLRGSSDKGVLNCLIISIEYYTVKLNNKLSYKCVKVDILQLLGFRY